MRRLQLTPQVLKGLFLVVLIFASCSSPSDNGAGGGCGGGGASVNCLNVVRITPTSTVSGDTSNVDALQDQCRDLTGTITGIEPFGDHNALVTLANTAFPTATGPSSHPLDIGVTSFTVTYTLNQCPAAARGCPPLTGFTTGASIAIPAGQTVTVTLPFVPISVKNQYVQSGGELGAAAPSYTVIYTFTAQTIGLIDTFTVQGSAPFTITDFNNCGT
jgi:hypothetical protein